jgi:predicted DNA-binding transcriptional regulator YafY
MFSENHINAFILAEQLVLKTSDASFIKDYSEAITKVKAGLIHADRDKANLLSERTEFSQNKNRKRTSTNLSDLQVAITNFFVVKIEYRNEVNVITNRLIEPFALINTGENWLLVAWCRLRNEFRYFRLDRIDQMEVLTDTFTPHKLTLQEYFDKFY